MPPLVSQDESGESSKYWWQSPELGLKSGDPCFQYEMDQFHNIGMTANIRQS